MPTSPRVRYKGRGRAGGVEPRPYGSATRGAMGGRPQGSPLRRGYKRCGIGIPQSRLCRARPPLGKGIEGTGGTDCHSQCAHWLRNDTLYEMRYESGRATARVAPTERNKKCHGRADVGIGPYEDVTSSAGQVRAGRPGGRPLRRRNKECGGAGRCGHRPLRRVT